MTLPEQSDGPLDLRAQQALLQAHAHARELEVERHAADQDAALELAADQGHSLRVVIAYAATAIVDALIDISVAIRETRR